MAFPFQCQSDISIFDEHTFDKLFKFLRWSKEPQVADAAFDRKFYLSGGAWLGDLFARNDRAKDAVYGLFEHAERYGKLRIHCRGGLLWLELKVDRRGHRVSFTMADVLAFGSDLFQLGQELERQAKPNWRLAAAGEKYVNPVMSAACWAALVTGAVLFTLYHMALSFKQFEVTRIVTIAATPTIFFATGLLLAVLLFNLRTPRLQRALGSFTLLWLPGVVLFSLMIHLLLNMRLDTSTSEQQCVSIVDKHISHEKSGSSRARRTSYYIDFEWAVRDEPLARHSWPVSQTMYKQAQIGDAVSFIKRRGYWDAPWTHAFEFGCRLPASN